MKRLDVANAHNTDENLRLDDLRAATKIVALAVADSGGGFAPQDEPPDPESKGAGGPRDDPQELRAARKDGDGCLGVGLEFISAKAGLGFLIINAQSGHDPNLSATA